MNRDKKEEHEEQPVDENRPYSFYEQKVASKHLHYYLSGVIEDPSKYTEMVHQIRTAGQNDVVHIHLNTPGGLVATGVQMISAMRASQAHVVTHLEGEACSMGALLFLAADEMVVYDDSRLMFHNYSSGTYGKGHEITSHIDSTNKWFTKLARTVCIPFLSEEELDDIVRGADYWMLSDEVKDRLQNMAKILDEEEKAKEEGNGKKTQRRKVKRKKTKTSKKS